MSGYTRLGVDFRFVHEARLQRMGHGLSPVPYMKF